MINIEQVKSLLRTAIQIGGTWAVAHDYLTRPQADSLEDLVYQGAIALIVAGVTYWGYKTRSDKNIIKAAEEVETRKVEEVRS